MMDLLSVVPYYTGHLCSALKTKTDVALQVGAISYHLDRSYFSREGLRLHPGAFNIVSRFPAWCPAWLRRVSKVVECTINLCALLLRFQLRAPTIVHVQFLPLMDLGLPCETWFLHIVKKMGIETVYTVHNILPHENGDRRRQRYQSLYRQAGHLICHDVAAKKELIEAFGIPPGKISVIPHGPLFAGRQVDRIEARRRLGLAETETVVLWQGIVRRYKGVPLLLRAWKELADEGVIGEAKLVVAGPAEPQLASEIRSECERLQVTASVDLRFGFAGVDELAMFFSAADVLVYPYHAVTTSGALMAGLQFGRAIVASRLLPFQEILHDGDDAFLFTPGNVAELKAALSRLLTDGALRSRFGARSFELGKLLTNWAEIADQTIICYRKVLGACGNDSANEPLSYDERRQEQEVV